MNSLLLLALLLLALVLLLEARSRRRHHGRCCGLEEVGNGKLAKEIGYFTEKVEKFFVRRSSERQNQFLWTGEKGRRELHMQITDISRACGCMCENYLFSKFSVFRNHDTLVFVDLNPTMTQSPKCMCEDCPSCRPNTYSTVPGRLVSCVVPCFRGLGERASACAHRSHRWQDPHRWRVLRKLSKNAQTTFEQKETAKTTITNQHEADCSRPAGSSKKCWPCSHWRKHEKKSGA